MKRIAVLAVVFLFAACSGTPPASTGGPATNAPAATTAPGGTGGGTGGSGSILDAATAAAAHLCNLLPTELVPQIVPSPPPPTEQQFPPTCTVYGPNSSIQIELDLAIPLGDTPQGATAIPNLGQGAFLELLTPKDPYLSVALTKELGVLHVGGNFPDDTDHTEVLVNVAKAVLAKLGG